MDSIASSKKNVHIAHMPDFLDPLFEPLARLLVARGVPFAELSERMKAHYVQAAKSLAEGKVTDSRLSVMTGLQRREITRLREFAPRQPKPSHEARLVALWQSEPGYHSDGAPLELPKNGEAPSFEALARNVRRDVHPRTILDTLEMTGTVRVEPETQTVRLIETSYQPLAGSEEQLDYLAKNLGDHLAAANDNVQGVSPPHFERAVHYTGLTEGQIEELQSDYHSAQMAVLEQLSRKAAAMKKSRATDATRRFRAGGYFFQTGETGK